MPHPSLDSFFFWNSGSEAVEAAIKMARWFTKKQNIICMQGAYHGRTFGAMAVTKSKTIYSAGTHPLMPGVFSIPYPYWHQSNVPVITPAADLSAHSLYQLELLLAQQTAPADTAAIIIEPVLGEGGYVAAPIEFLQGVRKICDKHNIMLIIDEVQSGFGRAGAWFAIEESGVKPDILVMAKGLGNGFPISGVVSRKELTDKLKVGSMVSPCLPSTWSRSLTRVGRNIRWKRGRVRCCGGRQPRHGRGKDSGQRPGTLDRAVQCAQRAQV
jgi:4-aminobutyrate aminotransferase